MNRRKLLGLGGLGMAAVAAPFLATACALTPRRIQDQVIDGALVLTNCQNMTISNCSFQLQREPQKGAIYFHDSDQSVITGNCIYS